LFVLFSDFRQKSLIRQRACEPAFFDLGIAEFSGLQIAFDKTTIGYRSELESRAIKPAFEKVGAPKSGPRKIRTAESAEVKQRVINRSEAQVRPIKQRAPEIAEFQQAANKFCVQKIPALSGEIAEIRIFKVRILEHGFV
jgi:hypothetical protein